MPLTITLPPNLCADKSYFGKSVYWVDYCSKSNRLFRKNQLKKQTKKWSMPGVSYPLSDHYRPATAGEKEISGLHQREAATQNATKQVMFNVPGRPRTAPSQTSRQGSRSPIGTEKALTLADVIPDTMNELRDSWENEADATKRERGVMYGQAGKKLTDRETEKLKREKAQPKNSLPGLENWLSTANEYEKQVVYSFMTTVSDPKPIARPRSAPAQSVHRKSSAEMLPSPYPSHIKTTPIHGNTPRPRSTPVRLTPTLLQIQGSEKYPRPPSGRANSVNQHRRSQSCTPPMQDDCQSRPDSAHSPVNGQRQRVNHHAYKHDEMKCSKCRDALIGDIVKELRRQTHKDHGKHNETKATDDEAFLPDDYVHERAMFTTNTSNMKGYFIVHPDWISENRWNNLGSRR